jgi:peptidoglycan hydrolase CwlO-like protein
MYLDNKKIIEIDNEISELEKTNDELESHLLNLVHKIEMIKKNISERNNKSSK